MFLSLVVALMIPAFADMAAAHEDIDSHRECNYCGMDRKAYGFSRMVIIYKDGAKAGVCSVHCTITELDSNKGREIATMLVADRNTRNLVDVEKATWVIGGNKRGVMTMRPKWAFATKESAQSFISKHGGAIASWPEVLVAAREDARKKTR